jgi:ribonuclease HII
MVADNPTFEPEQEYWQQGITLLAGIDEAGMGALAGPVVAAAVVFDSSGGTQKSKRKSQNYGVASSDNVLVRDSKTLSARQREKAAGWIKGHALAWAVGVASVEEITSLNIRVASHLAMRRAVDRLAVRPDLLLVDGTPAQPHPVIPAVNIVDGDALSLSIAAAGILAKVHRDDLMCRLDRKFPVFGFASHKGYGSVAHLAVLAKLGPCSCHRPTYAPVAAAFDNPGSVR